MKMIDHPTAHTLAVEQALMGRELAFQANAARDFANDSIARRNAALDEASGRSDFDDILSAQDGVRTEARAYYAHYRQLTDAAGALIGRYTLGSEILSIENGNDPVLSSDGSYISGSAN